MILSPHIVVGATIGAKTQNLGLIVILGLLTHLILDKIPHWDYDIKKDIKNFRENKSFKALFLLFLKMGIDIIFGFLIVFVVAWKKHILIREYLPFIVFGIFISLLPDILLGLAQMFASKNFLEKYIKFHYKFLHHPENKQKEGKITFLGLATEILVIIICVFLLNL